MALKIRLARGGTKKRPHYNIVIADSRSPRDGRFIEKIGFYNPLLPKDHADRVKLDTDKAKDWMKKGEFDMNDLADQLRQMRKMGGMQGVLAMLPGVGRVKDQLAAAGLDDNILTRQEAIISSMTRQERAKPDVINGSRRKRIAAGSGVDVSEVNKLLKMHRTMADVMKKMGKGGRAMQGLASMFGGGGAMPPGVPRR